MKESLITKLYDATNNGLDIIFFYYPQARECDSGQKKFFRIRSSDKTPSASLKQIKGVWRVTDFGDDASAIDPISICMREHHIEFREALHRLCDQYGVSSSPISATNKAEMEVRPAADAEPEGEFKFELNEKFTEFELSVLGPMVTADTCARYSYFSVKSYTITKNRKTTTIRSTDTYPIFMRECGNFRKLYQPLNHDKAFRFFYNGTKPKDFINGLKELESAYKNYIKKLDEEELEDFGEEKAPDTSKKKKPRKLPEAIFCSGERDALNVAGMGYFPLWLNSETAHISKFEMNEIAKLVEKIYNIPDIDETGIKKAKEFALEHIEVFTVELPKWLPTYKDSRGKPRKDLRDYLDLRNSKYHFDALLNMAKPCKFWETVWVKDGKRVEINSVYFLHFLKYNGFGKITDKATGVVTYCRIKGHKVERIITGKTIRNFVINYLEEKQIELSVHNLFINSTKTNISMLDNMADVEIDFTDHTMNSQLLFFDNIAINIFKDKIEEIRGDGLSCKVWESEVSPHFFRRLPRSFEWNWDVEEEKYNLDIKNTDSHYFRVLINASRVFWREELEYNNPDYELTLSQYHFDINGLRLKGEEREEQIAHLLNKIYTIGYILHNYKSYAKALSVWIMENKVTEESESSGGSGKSFMIDFLKNICNIITLPGRDKELTKRQFFMDRVTEYTDIIRVDDAERYFQFNAFYSFITGDMEINKKFEGSKEISYKQSPKLVITSNFPPRDDDGSTMRRMLMCVFSDYYHKKTDKNNYQESRTIQDDFGYELHNELYKAEWWNQDFNFCVDCLQFYLSTLERDYIVYPPMYRVQERINLAQIGEAFKEWADVYFAEESENLDKKILKSTVHASFDPNYDKSSAKMTSSSFKKKLKTWIKTKNYIECFNPQELQNDKEGRILNKIDGETREFIYIKSKGKEINYY